MRQLSIAVLALVMGSTFAKNGEEDPAMLAKARAMAIKEVQEAKGKGTEGDVATDDSETEVPVGSQDTDGQSGTETETDEWAKEKDAKKRLMKGDEKIQEAGSSDLESDSQGSDSQAEDADSENEFSETAYIRMLPKDKKLRDIFFVRKRSFGKLPFEPLVAKFPDFKKLFTHMKGFLAEKAKTFLMLEDQIRSQFQVEQLKTQEDVDNQAMTILPLIEQYIMKNFDQKQIKALGFKHKLQLRDFIEAVGDSMLPYNMEDDEKYLTDQSAEISDSETQPTATEAGTQDVSETTQTDSEETPVDSGTDKSGEDSTDQDKDKSETPTETKEGGQ